MAEAGYDEARSWRHALLGAGSAAAMSLLLALGAALGQVRAAPAAAGCALLAALAAASFWAARKELGARLPLERWAATELVALAALLAWLTYASSNALAVVAPLYGIAMLYGVLMLDRTRLVLAAAVAVVLHGTALFMLADSGHRVGLAALWTQVLGLAIGFGWCALASGVPRRQQQRLARARRALHDAAEDAREGARRDALTGSYSRAYLAEALEREIARAERLDKPLALARIDLDRLGAINATHGAAAGDVALRRFAAAATHALRDVDVFGRLGGKEFLALMPDTDLAGAAVAAERLRAAAAGEPLPETAGRRHLSCTAGVVQHRRGEIARLLLARADGALNAAKAGGRDRVVAL